jgi:hypothetical protein
MWGRATLTIVVSRTTMSWEVRTTKRNTEGLASRRRRDPGPLGEMEPAVSGRDSTSEDEGMDFRSFRWYRDE